MHAKQDGVQGLVAVGFGDRDIVFEMARNGLIAAVDGSENTLAGIGIVDHNTKSIDIHDLRKGLFLVAHLLIDAVQMFFPALYLGVKVFAIEVVLNSYSNFFDNFLAVATNASHCCLDAIRAHRMQR